MLSRIYFKTEIMKFVQIKLQQQCPLDIDSNPIIIYHTYVLYVINSVFYRIDRTFYYILVFLFADITLNLY